MKIHISEHIHQHIQIHKYTHTPDMATECNQSQPKQLNKTLPQNKIKKGVQIEHKIPGSILSIGGK